MKGLLSLLLAVLSIGMVAAQTDSAGTAFAACERFLADPALRTASVSISVLDARTGDLLFQRNPHTALVPASSLKLMTTSAALELLGPDFRFRTDIFLEGEFNRKRHFEGNLVVSGSGDPSLCSPDLPGLWSLDTLYRRIGAILFDSLHIKRIHGRVIVPDTFFSGRRIPETWQWEDLGNYFACGVSSLNVRENTYTVHFLQESQVGKTAKRLFTDPVIPGLVIRSQVITDRAGTGDNANIYGGPDVCEVTIKGSIPAGQDTFRIKGSIPNPCWFVEESLTASLRASGIRIEADPIENTSGRIPVLRLESPSLIRLVQRANKKSVNLYCEALVKTLGKVLGGEGSYERGLAILDSFWRKRIPDTEGMHLEDGSGLSARNSASSYQLAFALQRALANPVWGESFRASLPVAGIDGTLERMFTQSPARGKILAKSGSMKRVRSYTGLALGPEGRELVFSVVVNNYSCSGPEMRKKLEALMESFTE